MATRDEKRAHFRRVMGGNMDKSADQLIAEAAARASGQAAPETEPEAVQAEQTTTTEETTAAPAQAEPQAAQVGTVQTTMTDQSALISLAYYFGVRYKNPDQVLKAIKEKADHLQENSVSIGKLQGVIDSYEARIELHQAEAKAATEENATQATRIAELETALEALKATHETEIRHLIDAHAAELAKALSTPA